ncbi:protocatechuate 3,4-dioxygenase subunit alpha [Piscinibacter sakaiensis]|uniref:Protocatechuate 3,4-dioxygenase, alpha chain n=1 Tax=Piscinibacter sakaiensis TaxID=1547922 RepID=A0A0K8NXF4_PISS1|nr:protocatechuate 3,4-dioxygenase subunit alpha [Piscinibacter sakaiensis]GAP35061.1 protocatechuate 3,4-dioxygenase, alpha chain [Piscinibacter sakaiensis]
MSFRPIDSPLPLRETASQTAGPYVHIGLAPRQAGFEIFENDFGPVLVTPQTRGRRIRIEGTVIDGSGTLVRDALLECWQANADGRYAHPGDRQSGQPLDPAFRGWGRACTDFDTGLYAFDTIKPGRVVGRNGRRMAPHVNLWVVARGINLGLNTRIYFDDEPEANAEDPVINLIEWQVRRQTLIARSEGERDGVMVYRFDVRLQGEGETVFFDV